jgi:hypothetical protein
MTGGGIIHLIEPIENLIELGGGNTDAGIGDRKAKLAGAVGSNGDFDTAVAGELDGVEKEIEQHLADTVWIGNEEGRAIGRDEGVYGNSGGSGGLHGADEIVQKGFDRERGEVNTDMASFEAGEFEDIVDDGEEGVGGVADGFGVLALDGAERRVE